MTKKEALIMVEYDGWTIDCDGKTYRYNHNDEDYGGKVLAKLLKDLGLKVKVEEAY